MTDLGLKLAVPKQYVGPRPPDGLTQRKSIAEGLKAPGYYKDPFSGRHAAPCPLWEIFRVKRDKEW